MAELTLDEHGIKAHLRVSTTREGITDRMLMEHAVHGDSARWDSSAEGSVVQVLRDGKVVGTVRITMGGPVVTASRFGEDPQPEALPGEAELKAHLATYQQARRRRWVAENEGRSTRAHVEDQHCRAVALADAVDLERVRALVLADTVPSTRRLLRVLRDLHSDGALLDCYQVPTRDRPSDGSPLEDALQAWEDAGYPGTEDLNG